jgi:hypothetical protein
MGIKLKYQGLIEGGYLYYVNLKYRSEIQGGYILKYRGLIQVPPGKVLRIEYIGL